MVVHYPYFVVWDIFLDTDSDRHSNTPAHYGDMHYHLHHDVLRANDHDQQGRLLVPAMEASDLDDQTNTTVNAGSDCPPRSI